MEEVGGGGGGAPVAAATAAEGSGMKVRGCHLKQRWSVVEAAARLSFIRIT